LPISARVSLKVFFLAFRQEALLVGGDKADEAINGVGRGMLAGVVVPHLELAQKTDGEHLDARYEQHRTDDKHGAMVMHQVQARVEYLHPQQQGSHEAASHHAQQAKSAEEVKRTAHVLEQEADGQKVKEDAEGAADTVVAFAPLAIDVADGNLADGSAIQAGQGGNEAMHLAVERNVVNDLAAIGLEGGAEIMDIDPGEFGHQPVCAARGNAAQDEIVDAVLAPPGDDVVSLIELFYQGGNVVGDVLPVASHGQDELDRGMVEACGQSRGLAKVAAQLDHKDAAVDCGNFFEELVGAVLGTVVNKHHLKAVAHLFHYLLQTGIQDGDVLLFVVKGHNNGVLRQIGRASC